MHNPQSAQNPQAAQASGQAAQIAGEAARAAGRAAQAVGRTAPSATPDPQFIVRVPSASGETFTITPPRTARDVEALKARREELSNQLQSVDSRRSKLISQLKQTSDPTAVKGLENRLALLDARQLQLETDIQTTGQQLTSPEAGRLATTSDAPFAGGMSNRQQTTLSILGIIFVLFPISIGIARGLWRRASRQGPPPTAFAQTAQRLERLEESVDAIAVEVERISEGQRFVTKLLSEGQPTPKLVAAQRAGQTV
jgi:archaellum component FlaC